MRDLARHLPLLLVLAAPLEARIATLVKDINVLESSPRGPSSFPGKFLALSDRVVFVASDPGLGEELWASDGTTAGTELLADICPGGCSARPAPVGIAGGASIWSVTDEEHSSERTLWRSDGTRGGTFPLASAVDKLRVADPRPGEAALLRGKLFIAACTDERGCELWTSDGTLAGTRPVFAEATEDRAGPRGLTAAGGRLFFVAQSVLWVSDGTPEGTAPLRGFGTTPRALTAAGSRLFFIARADGTFGDDDEIWVSDGTGGGTRQVSRFVPPSVVAATDWLKPIGGAVYFVADDVVHGQEIWRSDGTEAGTRRVTEFGFHAPFDRDPSPDSIEEVGGRLVFIASDGLTPPQWWVTNGDPASTSPLIEECSRGCPAPSSTASVLKLGGRLYFPADDGEHGTELWSANGIPAETRIVRDICPGFCNGLIVPPASFGDQLLFAGTSVGSGGPAQLWRSDGTGAGTRPFTDLPSDARLFVSEWGVLRNRVLFAAEGPQGVELWSGNGRPGGTHLVRDLAVGAPASSPRELVVVGDRLFFRACDGRSDSLWLTAGSAETTSPLGPNRTAGCDAGRSGQPFKVVQGMLFYWDLGGDSSRQLWRTDGTPQGSVQLTHLVGTVPHPVHLAVLGNEVYFTVRYLYSGQPAEIWKSDGTPDGTGPALDLGGQAMEITDLTGIGEALYFLGYHPDEGYQFWRSDGTSAGTIKLRSGSNLTTPVGLFTGVGRLVYFIEETAGTTLWATDGTPEGTRRVAQLWADLYEDPVQLIAFQGSLYFFAPVLVGGYGLWTTDGTESGTRLVRSFQLEYSLGRPFDPHALVAGERLFFRASDGTSGRELWVSDGSTAGTRRVADLVLGPGSSDPTPAAAAAGWLFFVVHDAVHGSELWMTDGTAAGTRLAHDIAPGPASSAPAEPTVVGDRLYFSADDGLFGRELWALDLAQPPGVCQPSETALCLAGRFRVEAAWKDFRDNVGVGRTIPLTADTGAFWFFGPENVEVILKVLDGRPLNDHHWVFYGALSSVEYALTVTDVQTGLTARYWNTSGQLASVADTTGFGPLGAFSVVERSTAGPPPRVRAGFEPAAAAGACLPSPTRLCLRDGRFAVEATWKDFAGNTGAGTAVPLTADTGWFWFFGPTNVEVVLKVLDGTPLNGKHWVFYGALSSVEYTLRVTDTTTGKVKTYTNPSGNLASVADTGAF